MEVSSPCDYCGQKKATESCEMCGSNVCPEHKKEHGCALCDGGERTFS